MLEERETVWVSNAKAVNFKTRERAALLENERPAKRCFISVHEVGEDAHRTCRWRPAKNRKVDTRTATRTA